MKKSKIMVTLLVVVVVLLLAIVCIAAYSNGKGGNNGKNSESGEQNAIYAEAYVSKINEYENTPSGEPKMEIKYDLIYINGDDIPELVASHDGYFVGLYTYTAENGVATLMDNWGYGAMGNAGYKYVQRENIISNYNADYAGAVGYQTFYKINDAGTELEYYNSDSLSVWMYKDLNNDNILAENELVDSNSGEFYYNGTKEITSTEYANAIPSVNGEYEFILGTKSAAEMLSALRAN